MKIQLITVAALALSSVAVAQPVPATMPAAAPAAVPVTAPATDSRGIAVISAPATAPAGTNLPVTAPAGARLIVNPDQAAAFAPMAAAPADLPPCSKTVTDRCKQTYERTRH